MTDHSEAMTSPSDYIAGLFTGIPQHDRFPRLKDIYPTARMNAAPKPHAFAAGRPAALPATYEFRGAEKSFEAFLAETGTVALLVIENGAMRLERYELTGGRTTHWTSMSVAKSFISALVGIAIEEGLIEGVDTPVSTYLPELAGSAFDGVRLKDVLQMSSGAAWNEDYSDPNSDINKFRLAGTGEGSFNAIPPTLKPERAPGTFNRYNSAETQVLGMLLVAVTGRSIRDYMEEKLWHPLGMESDGYWLTDSTGMEMAYGGLQATARDFAKIGQLYLQRGTWNGRQIVPESWVAASVTPDGPHLQPGWNDLSDAAFGYGYQWWVLDGTEGEYSAIGVYNQFVYVNPARNLVITKLSANAAYGLSNDETSYREEETIEWLRAIGGNLG